ncbi:MAG: GNAT family N-acetyltransferase [Ginsengibacter sp.]
MKLKIIAPKEDKSEHINSSQHCWLSVTPKNEFYEKVGFHVPWISYFIYENKTAVGLRSIAGKPVEEKVEIPYWTCKEFEKHGIASFAWQAPIAIAKKNDFQLTINAKTTPEFKASTRAFQNNGFTFFEIVQDNEIRDACL